MKKNPIKVFVWSWQNSIDTNISWVELQVRYLRRVQLFFPFVEKGIRSDKERFVIVNLVYSTYVNIQLSRTKFNFYKTSITYLEGEGQRMANKNVILHF